MFSFLAVKFEPQVKKVINDKLSQLGMQLKLLQKESLSISYFSLLYALIPPFDFFGFIFRPVLFFVHITTSSQFAW